MKFPISLIFATLLFLPNKAVAQDANIDFRVMAIDMCVNMGYISLGYGSEEVCIEAVYTDLLYGVALPNPEDPGGFSRPPPNCASTRIPPACPR